MQQNIYAVGGFVRDYILGIKSADIDYVAVGYKPEDFNHLQKVGTDFPVFLTGENDELALARTEQTTGAGYKDFSWETDKVTLEEDLSRRDLTINAMAVHETGVDGFTPSVDVIDPFNGQGDIQKRTLRHVSDAFKDDPVRVLRLARLRAKLPGFWRIAAETKVLVYSMRDQLGALTKERVWKEVYRAMDKNPHIFFETLFELGVLDVIFPEIYELTTLKEGSKWHMEASVFTHTMSMLEVAEESNFSITTKLAALYHDIAKPHCYRTFGNGAGHEDVDLVAPRIKLAMPVSMRKDVILLVANHIKIAKLEEIKLSKQVKLLESYRRGGEKLLEKQIQLLMLDDNCRETIGDERLPQKYFSRILEKFRAIQGYSPKAWLSTLEVQPSKEHLLNKMLNDKIKLIRKIK